MCPHSRRGFLCPPKHAPRCFCAAKILFWGNRAAGAGGTSHRRLRGNRPSDLHQPIPLEKVRTPKASLVGEKRKINHRSIVFIFFTRIELGSSKYTKITLLAEACEGSLVLPESLLAVETYIYATWEPECPHRKKEERKKHTFADTACGFSI